VECSRLYFLSLVVLVVIFVSLTLFLLQPVDFINSNVLTLKSSVFLWYPVTEISSI